MDEIRKGKKIKKFRMFCFQQTNERTYLPRKAQFQAGSYKTPYCQPRKEREKNKKIKINK